MPTLCGHRTSFSLFFEKMVGRGRVRRSFISGTGGYVHSTAKTEQGVTTRSMVSYQAYFRVVKTDWTAKTTLLSCAFDALGPDCLPIQSDPS